MTKAEVQTQSRKKSKEKVEFSDRLIDIVAYTVVIVGSLLCIFPFLLVLVSSFSSEMSIINNGFKLIPDEFSLEAYKLILSSDVIYNAYSVTIFVTLVGTALSLLITSCIAYPLSLDDLKYKNNIAFFVYFTMLFNGGLVPTYLLISKYLKMTDNIWVLIIPVVLNPWNMFLLRNFFKTIPKELAESAKIDGAGDIYILFKIILPISKPGLATIGLFYALGYWNEWFRAMLFIKTDTKYPLQYLIMKIIRNIQFAQELSVQSGVQLESVAPSYSVRMATAILTIGPIVFVYPFVQKYFVKGMMVGSVKG